MIRKKKLLLMTTDSRLSGTEKTLLTIARALDKAEYNPHICTLLGESGGLLYEARKSGIPAYSLRMRSKLDVRAFKRFVAYLKREDFDIVHSFLFHANLMARTAKRGGAIKRLIASERFVDYNRSRWKVGMNKLFQKNDDLMTCNCAAIRLMIQKRERYPSEKIRVIYNGVDLNEKKPTISKGDLRKQHAIPVSAKVVVMAARFRIEKGHAELIRAIPKILKLCGDVVFILAGDGENMQAMKDLAVEMHVAQRVIFPGYANVYNYFNVCDVAAHISHDEGLPNSVIEAFSLKKPVVATDTAGTGEIVQDGVNGYLVPEDNNEKISNAIIMLLKDAEKAADFGQKGFQHVESSFSKDVMIKKYETLYHE